MAQGKTSCLFLRKSIFPRNDANPSPPLPIHCQSTPLSNYLSHSSHHNASKHRFDIYRYTPRAPFIRNNIIEENNCSVIPKCGNARDHINAHFTPQLTCAPSSSHSYTCKIYLTHHWRSNNGSHDVVRCRRWVVLRWKGVINVLLLLLLFPKIDEGRFIIPILKDLDQICIRVGWS